MQSVLIVVHLMIVVVLVVTVLLQRSEGGALGVGGGGGFMTGRGQASALTRATAVLAALFFATSMGLTILARYNQAPEVTFQSITPIEPPSERRGKRGGGQGKFARPIETDGRPGGQAAGASAGYDLAGPASTRRARGAARSEFASRKSARDAPGSAGAGSNRTCRASARFHHGATGAATGRARPGQGSAPGLGSTVVEITVAFMCKKGSGA